MLFKTGHTVELTGRDFSGKRIIKNTVPIRGIVMFGAEWCGFCRRAAPEFEKSAKLLKGMYTFYHIDADKNKDLVKKFDIQGYPTIKFVDNNGNIYKDYSSERSVQGFLDNICMEASVCKKYSF